MWLAKASRSPSTSVMMVSWFCSHGTGAQVQQCAKVLPCGYTSAFSCLKQSELPQIQARASFARKVLALSYTHSLSTSSSRANCCSWQAIASVPKNSCSKRNCPVDIVQMKQKWYQILFTEVTLAILSLTFRRQNWTDTVNPILVKTKIHPILLNPKFLNEKHSKICIFVYD